jgi:hypothetical protein
MLHFLTYLGCLTHKCVTILEHIAGYILEFHLLYTAWCHTNSQVEHRNCAVWCDQTSSI